MDEEYIEFVSKTELKKDSKKIQAFGKKISELSLDEIEESLRPDTPHLQMDFIAPASGLILRKLEFD